MILYHSLAPSPVDGARRIRTVGCCSEDGTKSASYSSDSSTPWIKWKGATNGSEIQVRTGWKFARYSGNDFPTQIVDAVTYLKAYLHIGITADGHMMVELDRNEQPNSLLDCYCIPIPSADVTKNVPFSVKFTWIQAPSMDPNGFSLKYWYANIYWQAGANPALVLNGVTANPKYDTIISPVWPRAQHNALAVYGKYWDELPEGNVNPAIGNYETAQALLANQDFMDSVSDAAKDAASDLMNEYKGRYVSC